MGQLEEKGTEFHKHFFWDLTHLFDTFSFHPLAGSILQSYTNSSLSLSLSLSLSSNHILFVYIAYLISFVSYQCLKTDVIAFQKRPFPSTYSPIWKAGGVNSPLPPSPVSLGWVFCFEQALWLVLRIFIHGFLSYFTLHFNCQYQVTRSLHIFFKYAWTNG